MWHRTALWSGTVPPVCRTLSDSTGLHFHSREKSSAIVFKSYNLETESLELRGKHVFKTVHNVKLHRSSHVKFYLTVFDLQK